MNRKQIEYLKSHCFLFYQSACRTAKEKDIYLRGSYSQSLENWGKFMEKAYKPEFDRQITPL